MTERIEYGSKDAADAARERHSEYLCTDDDRRLKTVAWAESGTPEWVLEQERLEAADSRDDGGDDGGQVPLSDSETDRIDFSDGRANALHARSVKGIAQSEGVEDWVSYYDPTLTVDEHREVMEQASRESGKRSADETADEKAARAARSAQSNQCDHARGHCLNGDPEACEFLQETCQMSLDDVMNDVLARNEPDRRPDPEQPDAPADPDPTELTGKQKGALQRSWNGYKAAMGEVEEALKQLANNWMQAQRAARAINAIRGTVGQTPLHFERLETEQAALMDLTREMAADCHECHADHSEHSHGVTDGPQEELPDAVVNGAADTPVGTGDEGDILEADDQRTLSGDRADDQARLAGGERGERGQGEVVEVVEENPGGLRSDERAESGGSGETEQQVPDEFAVAEGGQETL
ncbi:hypothetical protein [Haloarcula sp. H-GB5]